MKVTFKTLKKIEFVLEIDEDSTVEQLKAKIEEEKGAAYPAAYLKLIFQGKILGNESAMKDHPNVAGKGAFVVVMVTKKTAAAPSTEGSSSATPAPAATTPSTTAPTPAQPSATAPTTTAAPPAAPTEGAAGGLIQMATEGQDVETAVANLCNMGFPRSQVERALSAAFMNSDRAVEYLLNPASMPAVPAVAPAADAPATPQQPGPETPAATPVAAPTATGGAAGNLDFLRNTPQFESLRRLIENDPGRLEEVLQELGQANPQLLQAIQAHPDQFIRLLQAEGAGGQPQAPPPNTVQITSAEKEAIDRIKAMGFPEHEVVQAFFACDKDENLTANFLFDNQE